MIGPGIGIARPRGDQLVELLSQPWPSSKWQLVGCRKRRPYPSDMGTLECSFALGMEPDLRYSSADI